MRRAHESHASFRVIEVLSQKVVSWLGVIRDLTGKGELRMNKPCILWVYSLSGGDNSEPAMLLGCPGML